MARDNKAAYLRRNQLARQRGFRSYAQQRRYVRVPVNQTQLGGLPDQARSRRRAALRVINAARENHIPVAQAAAEAEVPLSAVAWWAAPALESPTSKAPRVRKADRLLRAYPVAVDGEMRMITTRGSNAAARAREAMLLQLAFLEGEPGAAQSLANLAGTRVGGYLIETDPQVLDEIGRRGELGDIGEMYRAWLA